MNHTIKNNRYIALVRTSTKNQADTSVPGQLGVIRAYARDHGLVEVDTVFLEGVSGSLPGARKDIAALIERKQAHDDFDLLIVQDATRLTRSGGMHGSKIEYDLNAHGIEIRFAADKIPDGDQGEIYKTFLHYASKQTAKSISFNATRGSMQGLLQGTSSYCKAPPYGLDRLYISGHEHPSHVIRNLADGTQVKLNPDTGEVTDRFGRNEATGMPAHYIKQKHERIMLVEGAPEHASAVRTMFVLRYGHGLGYHTIAKQLNDQGIASPRGGKWNTSVVTKLLLNPIYLGIGIANRKTSAIYHRRSEAGPQPSNVDVQTLATRERLPTLIRKRDEWFEREYPQLREFLPEDVREVARAAIEQELENQAQGYRPKPNMDRHLDSPYILKGLLHAKQCGCPMTGRKSGPRNTRYYAVSKGNNAPQSNNTLSKRVPAEPIEKAVLEKVAGVLTASPELRKQILDAINAEAKACGETQNGAALEKRRLSLVRQIKMLIEQSTASDDPEFKAALDDKNAQLREVKAQIAKLQSPKSLHGQDHEAIADRVVEQLGRLAATPASLRTILPHLISKLEVDLETREFDMELRLPVWAMDRLQDMGLEDTLVCKKRNEAHPLDGIVLAVFRCSFDTSTCCSCVRRKTAA